MAIEVIATSFIQLIEDYQTYTKTLEQGVLFCNELEALKNVVIQLKQEDKNSNIQVMKQLIKELNRVNMSLQFQAEDFNAQKSFGLEMGLIRKFSASISQIQQQLQPLFQEARQNQLSQNQQSVVSPKVLTLYAVEQKARQFERLSKQNQQLLKQQKLEYELKFRSQQMLISTLESKNGRLSAQLGELFEHLEKMQKSRAVPAAIERITKKLQEQQQKMGQVELLNTQIQELQNKFDATVQQQNQEVAELRAFVQQQANDSAYAQTYQSVQDKLKNQEQTLQLQQQVLSDLQNQVVQIKIQALGKDAQLSSQIVGQVAEIQAQISQQEQEMAQISEDQSQLKSQSTLIGRKLAQQSNFFGNKNDSDEETEEDRAKAQLKNIGEELGKVRKLAEVLSKPDVINELRKLQQQLMLVKNQGSLEQTKVEVVTRDEPEQSEEETESDEDSDE